jgi:hypothetical protein
MGMPTTRDATGVHKTALLLQEHHPPHFCHAMVPRISYFVVNEVQKMNHMWTIGRDFSLTCSGTQPHLLTIITSLAQNPGELEETKLILLVSVLNTLNMDLGSLQVSDLTCRTHSIFLAGLQCSKSTLIPERI